LAAVLTVERTDAACEQWVCVVCVFLAVLQHGSLLTMEEEANVVT